MIRAWLCAAYQECSNNLIYVIIIIQSVYKNEMSIDMRKL